MTKGQGLTWVGMVVMTLLATSSVTLPPAARADAGMRPAGFEHARPSLQPETAPHSCPARHGPWPEPARQAAHGVGGAAPRAADVQTVP
ncbi:hypothetical protein [Streptomyces antimicrobicus]|uniref:Secreted protein n=1 Tax=Streptomyces antimicrobicus TaxID=2883108 RepID=A0ABS8BBD1_9ACTN|nr:hypothetical protein [Streptomyces antimicrobicus]MCB5181947.1 hypothetical protein [Streptomyces antimicrobicus]